jgi:hypothetical protein
MKHSSDRRTGLGDKRIGLGLQVPSAALLDFARALSQPGEKGTYFSRTLAAVPKKVSAVTSSPTQAQMASSELTSGL